MAEIELKARNNHKPDCSCWSCKNDVAAQLRKLEAERQAAEQRRATEAEWRADFEAGIELIVWVVSYVARQTGQSAPDLIRVALKGDAKAIRVLRLGGQDADAIAARWAAAKPVRQQPAGPSWEATDPRYDERFLDGQLRDASVQELAAILAEIAADPAVHPGRARRAGFTSANLQGGMSVVDALEAADRQAEQARLAPQGTKPVPAGVTEGPGGAPVQRSVTHTSVPELGSEKVV